MKILFVCNEYPPEPHGGQGTFVKQIAHMLAGNHTIYVAGFYKHLKEPVVEMDDKVSVYKFPYPKARGILALLFNLISIGRVLNRLIREHEIEVAEFPDSGALNLFVTGRVSVFIRLHNTERYFQELIRKKRSRLLEVLENASLFRKVHLISVSHFIASEFLKYFYVPYWIKKRLVVIQNGINLSVFKVTNSTFNRSRNKIVFAGTYKPIKGVDFLLQAFKAINEEFSSVELHLYGGDTTFEGQSYKEYLISKTGIGSLVDTRIFFHGRVSNEQLVNIYNEAHLCVFPSLAESFGLVVIEAMACGCIVINSQYAAGKELIKDGINGFLVAPDDIRQLAGTIRHGLDLSASDASKITSEAINFVKENFSMEICVKKSETLYTRILNNEN